MRITAEQKIEKAHVSILQSKKFCFFAGMTMVGKVFVSDEIPTALTNGRDIWYGRAFIDSLNQKQVLFVVLHELSHMAWRHLSVWRHLYEKDPMLANAACDYVINLQLLDQDPQETEIQFPTDADGNRMGLIDEKYRGWDSKQVFDDLMQECEGDGEEEGEEGGGGDQEAEGGNEGHGNPGGDKPNKGKKGRSRSEISKKQFDEHDWENSKKLTDKEKQDLEGRITRALQQGKQLIGKMGGNMDRNLAELVQPEVDWRDVLRDLVKNICKGSGDSSWRRFSRRHLGADIYLPQNIDYRVGWVVDGTDTSGSIDGEILTKFMSEVKSICNEVMPEGLHHLYWDTQVAGHETYSQAEYDQIDKVTKPRGGGGTDPGCLPTYIKKEIINGKGQQVDVVIVLTDGYFHGEGNWSEVPCPVIWCVVDNPNFNAQSGKTVHIRS